MDTNTEQLSIIADGWLHKDTPTFEDLPASILQTHQSAQVSAIKAVNKMATLRNWLIGCYIVEYEQKGHDRAKYGERLLKRLEERVNTKGLKNDEFRHEYLGQLNAYVSYYKENEMREGDNPPVGILLCTRKGKKMVEYALAGMDNNLFVATYMLQLPDKATLENFLLNELEERL